VHGTTTCEDHFFVKHVYIILGAEKFPFKSRLSHSIELESYSKPLEMQEVFKIRCTAKQNRKF